MSPIARFFQLESREGVLLFALTVVAFIWCNSSLGASYQHVWSLPISIQIGSYSLMRPLLFWVNEGLMSLFFLAMGLELKYGFMKGDLAKLSQVSLPAIAALGGMIVPACIYIVFNFHRPEALQAWAVPVATDIAFALGALSLLGSRVPKGLKVFLMALAIFDDVGAIVIIALYHPQYLSMIAIGLALAMVMLLLLCNRLGVRKLWPYLFLGVILWLFVLKSRVHATIAGVILGLLIPIDSTDTNPLERLQSHLHPWVAYFIMPLFALANAGVSLQGLHAHIFTDTILLGIVCGLFFGKQLGVMSFSWVWIRFTSARLPEATSWLAFYAVSILCGIGFTMSLFLGTLAFQLYSPAFLVEVRLGVILGSCLSGMMGIALLYFALQSNRGKVLESKSNTY